MDAIESLAEKTINEKLDKYFAGYDGCFVLFNKNKNEYIIYNEAKSKKQISPCSTFKIICSLIGLETNVLQDENTAFKWDGTKYPFDHWNKDQTLSTAVSNSVVWYFMKLAAQVGKEKMQHYLDIFGYGNKDISGGLTRFWLQSSLKISPKEQVEILRKLCDYQLPASKRNIDIVKNVITLSNENGIKLSGKTGSGISSLNNGYTNGWFSGYVENNSNVYFFAANIEAYDAAGKNAGGAEAKEITLKILKDRKIY
jgi:beta-lactamase class D